MSLKELTQAPVLGLLQMSSDGPKCPLHSLLFPKNGNHRRFLPGMSNLCPAAPAALMGRCSFMEQGQLDDEVAGTSFHWELTAGGQQRAEPR